MHRTMTRTLSSGTPVRAVGAVLALAMLDGGRRARSFRSRDRDRLRQAILPVSRVAAMVSVIPQETIERTLVTT